MNIRLTGASLGIAAIGLLTAAGLRKRSGSTNEDEEILDDADGMHLSEMVSEALERKGFKQDLSNNFAVPGWIVGKLELSTMSRLTGKTYSSGRYSPVYLLDNEDDSYSTVLFFSGDLENPVDANGNQLPNKYREYHNRGEEESVIIDLDTFSPVDAKDVMAMVEEIEEKYNRKKKPVVKGQQMRLFQGRDA